MTKSPLFRLCTILTGMCLFLFLPALGHADGSRGSGEILISDEIFSMPDEVVRDSGSPPAPVAPAARPGGTVPPGLAGPPPAGPGGSGSPSMSGDPLSGDDGKKGKKGKKSKGAKGEKGRKGSKSRSGHADGTNPGKGSGTWNSPNQGTNNPAYSRRKK